MTAFNNRISALEMEITRLEAVIEYKNFAIIAASVGAWHDLIEQDKARGGDGKLRNTAISLMRERTMVVLHCNYSDDARMLFHAAGAIARTQQLRTENFS